MPQPHAETNAYIRLLMPIVKAADDEGIYLSDDQQIAYDRLVTHLNTSDSTLPAIERLPGMDYADKVDRPEIGF